MVDLLNEVRRVLDPTMQETSADRLRLQVMSIRQTPQIPFFPWAAARLAVEAISQDLTSSSDKIGTARRVLFLQQIERIVSAGDSPEVMDALRKVVGGPRKEHLDKPWVQRLNDSAEKAGAPEFLLRLLRGNVLRYEFQTIIRHLLDTPGSLTGDALQRNLPFLCTSVGVESTLDASTSSDVLALSRYFFRSSRLSSKAEMSSGPSVENLSTAIIERLHAGVRFAVAPASAASRDALQDLFRDLANVDFAWLPAPKGVLPPLNSLQLDDVFVRDLASGVEAPVVDWPPPTTDDDVFSGSRSPIQVQRKQPPESFDSTTEGKRDPGGLRVLRGDPPILVIDLGEVREEKRFVEVCPSLTKAGKLRLVPVRIFDRVDERQLADTLLPSNDVVFARHSFYPDGKPIEAGNLTVEMLEVVGIPVTTKPSVVKLRSAPAKAGDLELFVAPLDSREYLQLVFPVQPEVSTGAWHVTTEPVRILRDDVVALPTIHAIDLDALPVGEGPRTFHFPSRVEEEFGAVLAGVRQRAISAMPIPESPSMPRPRHPVHQRGGYSLLVADSEVFGRELFIASQNRALEHRVVMLLAACLDEHGDVLLVRVRRTKRAPEIIDSAEVVEGMLLSERWVGKARRPFMVNGLTESKLSAVGAPVLSRGGIVKVSGPRGSVPELIVAEARDDRQYQGVARLQANAFTDEVWRFGQGGVQPMPLDSITAAFTISVVPLGEEGVADVGEVMIPDALFHPLHVSRTTFHASLPGVGI